MYPKHYHGFRNSLTTFSGRGSRPSALFRRLDPGLWKESGYNPVVMLGRVSQNTLKRAATDPRYLAQYAHACQRFDAHMQRPVPPEAEGKLIAYFSMEYGLTECMPIYSGGLGVLSGDHLKSASDCDLPLVGVALLYQQGYFRQYLNPDGWQQERYLENDFYSLPDSARRSMPMATSCMVDVQLARPGRLPSRSGPWMSAASSCYLLDTNIPDNARPEDRAITSQLYGGDNDTRIRQEIVLGIGGMRALEALGLQAHRVPHERRPLGVPGDRAHPAADSSGRA